MIDEVEEAKSQRLREVEEIRRFRWQGQYGMESVKEGRC
jgi:hypothetical protein